MSAPIFRYDIEQGSSEWREIRAGKWSASKAAVIMGGLDTGGLADYIKDLAWERVHGSVEPGYKSAAMERGHVVESEARDWYAFEKDVEVVQVGCVLHATLANVIWSPDGLVGEHGAIEAKCPLARAWMECKRMGKVPSEYRWQTKFGMWVGQREWMDFLSYHPQPGGLIVPCEVTSEDKERMEERIALLEPKVQKWVDILSS